MRIFGLNITRASKDVDLNKIDELTSLLSGEMKAREAVVKEIEVAKAKHEEEIRKAKQVAEKRQATQQQKNAETALSHLRIAERMTNNICEDMSKTRLAEYNACIVARLENVENFGFSVDDIPQTITRLEKIANGN